MNAARHLASALAVGFLAGPALAAEPGASDWAGEAEGRARLVAGQTAAGPDGRLPLAVEIRLAPGWHTYWRDPGDSGAPPEFDWSGSENLAEAVVRWPAPRRFQAFGLDGYGWKGEVAIPVEARIADPGAPALLRLRLDYQVCAEICIPARADLALELEPGQPRATEFAPLLARWRARLPRADGSAIIEAVVDGAPGRQVLQVLARSAAPFTAPDLFVEAPPPFRFGRPEIELVEGEARFALPVRAGKGKPSLAGRKLVLTLTDGDRAAEFRLVPSDPR